MLANAPEVIKNVDAKVEVEYLNNITLKLTPINAENRIKRINNVPNENFWRPRN